MSIKPLHPTRGAARQRSSRQPGHRAPRDHHHDTADRGADRGTTRPIRVSDRHRQRAAPAGRSRGSAAWSSSACTSASATEPKGLTGVIQESLSGFWLGVMFLLSGRDLTLPIVAHGVSNTLAFVLIYYDRYPGIF